MYPGAHAATRPDHPAVIMASDGRTITYRELDEEANRLSQLFRSLGLAPGDHVAFCLENNAHFLSVAWGCHYAGLYYTAMSSRLNDDEMQYILNDCGAKAFITSAYVGEAATKVLDKAPNVDTWLMIGGVADGYASYEETIAAQPAEPLAERPAGIDMLYSSGTTGRPKGVKAPLSGTPVEEAGGSVLGLCQLLFGLTEDTVYLSPAPLYHAAPLRFCMANQMAGATVIVMERFDPEDALRLIEQYRVTLSQWVPTMFIRMLKLDEAVRTKYDVSSLEVAIHAAAPCPVEVKKRMIEWWGPVIHEYYAGSEGNGFVYCNSEQWLEHPGTVGVPVLGTVHIVDDETGDELPVGEAGTIYFEGEQASTFQYHNDAEKTEGSRDPKGRGWSTLGDVGRVDEDGFVYLTDRKAYMIISGGVNIYPQEAENALALHPKVYDVAVFGVPNEDFGEEVKAVVQLADGVEGTKEVERELIEFCRSKLADVKCPRSVDFRDELPRHPTGKLYKRLLKDEYWEGHESGII